MNPSQFAYQRAGSVDEAIALCRSMAMAPS